jgi:phosphopantothenoylcysteine decarboxylase
MTMDTRMTTDPMAGMSPPEKLLIGVSGSVAVLDLPSYLYALRAAGVPQIAAVLTATAESFLPASTLRLVCDGVYTEQDHGRGHVALGRWPDRVLVLPATAHLLGCVACGLAPSLLATTLLATEAPITFVPAMNPAMWRKAVVRRNVMTLRADGHQVLEPLPGAAFEVASRAIVPSLMVPPPEVVLRCLSGEPVAEGAER